MVNEMEEGRKRVLGIMASILVARHLKTTEDLHDNRSSPRTESLVDCRKESVTAGVVGADAFVRPAEHSEAHPHGSPLTLSLRHPTSGVSRSMGRAHHEKD